GRSTSRTRPCERGCARPTSPSTACGSERAVPRASGQTTIAALLVARSVIEAALFAALVALAQVATGGAAVPIVSVGLALTGVGIVLASILRDARADRQNTAIAVAAMAAAAAFGVANAPPHADGVMILTRVVGF